MAENIYEPLNILLVEDDPDLRNSLEEILKEEGYQVEAVASGVEAIALSTHCHFDLIVTDIKTSGATDGLSALEQVKRGNPEVAGIVITGYSNEEYASRAAKLKLENYLKKPFDIEDFLRSIDELAEKKRGLEASFDKDLLIQRIVRWLSGRLAQYSSQREVKDIDAFFERAAQQAPTSFREPRDILAIETKSLFGLLEQYGLSCPEDYTRLFPAGVMSWLLGSEFQVYLQAVLESFSSGQELQLEEPEGSEAERLSGSLLNVAIQLESAKHWREAARAFENLLLQTADPSQRYLAHQGLARISSFQSNYPAAQEQAKKAVGEACRLGPITHMQVLAESGILLARSGFSWAQEALGQAFELAKSLKEAEFYALICLAQEFFYKKLSPQKMRLLDVLARPEGFALAVEHGDWLLDLLLSANKLEAVERRLVARLVRSLPSSFEDAIEHSEDPLFLRNAVAFVDLLAADRQERVLGYLSFKDDAKINQAISQRRKNRAQSAAYKEVVRVLSFSGLRLYRDDEALEVKRKKPILLLLYLLYRNVPVGEEILMELFWPGEESKARASLRTSLSYLRKLLCPQGNLDPIVRLASGLTLNQELSLWFDYREFEALIGKGRELNDQQEALALDCFRSAVRLYRGPFLESCYDDWAVEAREKGERDYEYGLFYLASSYLKSENWGKCYEYAARGLRRDSLSQPFAEMAMKALIGLKMPHDALKVYQESCATLKQELDLEPSIEMIRCRELAKLSL